eukprot:1518740-Rhodomonas_salina.1
MNNKSVTDLDHLSPAVAAPQCIVMLAWARHTLSQYRTVPSAIRYHCSTGQCLASYATTTVSTGRCLAPYAI